jgi:WXG100 family type VII secretion target
MSDIIKMDYAAMEEMANIFKKAAGELDDLKKNMQKIADEMDGGALVGSAGQAFSNGIREALCPAIERLSQKMGELQGDIWGALVDLRDEDHEAASRFKGR